MVNSVLENLIKRGIKNFQEVDLRKEKFKLPEVETEIKALAESLVSSLKKKKIFLATMESCTGGALINEITNIPGASKITKGGFVTYSNQEKIARGVPKELIDKFSVYSPQIAIAMAWRAIKEIKGSQVGIGITGILSTKADRVNIAVILNEKKFLVRKFYLPFFKERVWSKKIIVWKTLEMVEGVLDGKEINCK